MIKINGNSLPTSKPQDLDEQLIASTGHGVREVHALLGGGPGLAARALAPFLGKDAPALNELACDIAADPDSIGAIAKLYALPADVVVEVTAQ
ncbi:hypothetical protein [Sphingomonas sp. PAMC 26621]|uniref:hypothetical protein n=1 Tax=Sphingomonas sp. PAMC 26621 TaxID=1112213 RepID=UPI000289E8BA|nr:hypothetical protein [Sphingomonas sp. PAMC 26621]